MNFGISAESEQGFEETVNRVRSLLKEEGFGVLTEIDVKKTMKEKLDVEYQNYIILGACNPQFANKALESDKEIGLLLPCNIIVYEEDKKTKVSAINPIVAMSIVENKEIEEVGKGVSEKLKRIIDSINDKKGESPWRK